MSITFEADLEADSSAVFAHLTDAALLTQWWPTGAETDPRPGGAYHLWWEGPGWHLRGQYLEVDSPSRLAFTWTWDHETIPERRVDVAVSQRDHGAHLTIRHEAGSEEEGAGYKEGWEHFIGQLQQLLGPDG